MGHAVDLQKLADHLRTKGVSCSARREGEFITFGIGIGPDEISHRAFVRDLAEAVDDLDLINGVDRGRKSAMDTEDLVVDHNAEGEEVEHVGEVVPDVGVPVFAGALGVEAVGLSYAARFVITADEVYAIGVSKLQANKERDGLDAEETSINVVAWEGFRLALEAQVLDGKKKAYPGKDSSCLDSNHRS